MKKVLYIALAVQSLALLGVVGALIYSAFSTPRGAALSADAPDAEVDSGLDVAELEPLKPPPREADAGETSLVAAESRDGQGAPKSKESTSARESSRESAVKESMAELMEGNERFARGLTRLKDPLELRKAPGRPRAVVVACSDAVVPPEVIFDQPLGSLVVARAPAHFVDVGAVAAVDDALTRQGVPVVVVLGHLGCPTVGAALAEPSRGEPALAPRLRAVLEPLKAGWKAADALGSAVEANTSWAVNQLVKSSKGLRATHPTVLRVVYDEATGQVRWLDAESERSADTPH